MTFLAFIDEWNIRRTFSKYVVLFVCLLVARIALADGHCGTSANQSAVTVSFISILLRGPNVPGEPKLAAQLLEELKGVVKSASHKQSARLYGDSQS